MESFTGVPSFSQLISGGGSPVAVHCISLGVPGASLTTSGYWTIWTFAVNSFGIKLAQLIPMYLYFKSYTSIRTWIRSLAYLLQILLPETMLQNPIRFLLCMCKWIHAASQSSEKWGNHFCEHGSLAQLLAYSQFFEMSKIF